MARLQKPFFSRTELDVWVGGTSNRRDALLRRAMAAGEVVRVRRGLYVLGPPYQKQKPDPLVLAQHVYGPSYISMESALAFHSWIPEAVYTVASVSMNRSRVFETPVGRFEYVRVPQHCFYVGVERIELPDRQGTVLMADPLKALADLVYARRLDQPLESLLGNFRVDRELLDTLPAEQVEELAGNYSVSRVKRMLQQIRTEVAQ